MAINLDKITLEKQGDSHRIDLTKRGDSPGKEILINLNWTRKKGFWSSMVGGSVDLDLGCFYELRNGDKSVIDGLQFAKGAGGPRNISTRQGYYDGASWIWHSGDDRSGGDGETIMVNPQGAGNLKRIVVYCFIYQGAARWAETNAVATIKVSGNPDVAVEMGKQSSAKTFCALSEILFDKSGGMTVKKLVTFHNGHSDCDVAYNWGMQWRAGGK